MIERSTSRHNGLAASLHKSWLMRRHSWIWLLLAVGCGGPSAVIHVQPAGGLMPTVNVSVCPVGTTSGDCAMTPIFNMDSTQSRSLALFDTGHDAAVALLFIVSDLGPVGYCEQIPSLDLAHGNKDFTVAIDSCGIEVTGLTPAPATMGCSAAPSVICGPSNDCGPASSTVCDGNGKTTHPVCCENGQVCDSSRTCS